jgi:hypothetical protein
MAIHYHKKPFASIFASIQNRNLMLRRALPIVKPNQPKKAG